MPLDYQPSCPLLLVKLVTTYIHIFNLSSLIHIKIMSNSWFTHKTLSQSCINIPIKPLNNNSYKYQLNIQAQREPNSGRILAQLVAQVGGSRSSEKDSRSSKLPLPRRELDPHTTTASAHSRLSETPLAWARLPSPEQDTRSLKTKLVAWATLRVKSLGESLLISPGRDRLA